MPLLTLTPLYALPLVLAYIVLANRVIGYRKDQRVSLGDGGDATLNARIRAHGNFAEYVPLGLILLAMAEANAAPAPLLHLTGASLVTGRGLHAWCIGWRGPMWARVAGMALTFTALILGAGAAAWMAL